MSTQWRWLAMLAFLLTALVTGTQAAPPTFRIEQVYTTMDGNRQIVELVEYAGLDDQHRWAGLTFTMARGARIRTITFSSDLPTTRTAGRTVLVESAYGSSDPFDDYFDGWPVYADESGTMHYIATPPRFIDTLGGTLDFAGGDRVELPPLPLDGSRAWHRDGTLAPVKAPVTGGPFLATTELYNWRQFAFLPSTDALEIEAVEEGRVPGWSIAEGWIGVSVIPDGAFAWPVCRFLAPSSAGGGHVLSAFPDECARLADPASGLVLESTAVFYVALPDPVTGACAAGVPIYRYWNRFNGADHRYTRDKPGFPVGPLAGYVSEGYGPDGVAFCASN